MGDCKARRYSDQMICGRCGLTWDVNDPEPPKCLSREEFGQKKCSELRDVINKNSK